MVFEKLLASVLSFIKIVFEVEKEMSFKYACSFLYKHFQNYPLAYLKDLLDMPTTILNC